MPRTRNVTREQWDAVASADPGASTIRSLGSTSSQHQRNTSRSSFGYGHAEGQKRRSSIGSSKENYGYADSGEENNENTNTTPLVKGKGKGKEVDRELGGRVSRTQPLQDITDIVIPRSNLPSEVEDIPRRRRKRVREILDATPLSPLSPSPAKRRTPIRTPRNVRFPSSLPPSSPPPQLPLSFEQPTSDSRQRNEVWKDIVPEEQEDLPLASDDVEPRRNSDPFGFFAVEKELKAGRAYARAGPSTELREAGGLVLVPATSPLRLDLSAAVEAGSEEESEMVSPCATPPTPHKKKRKRRVSILDREKEKEMLLLSPRTESLPSSPSPSKVHEPWAKRHVVQDHSDFVRSTTGHSDGALEEAVNADDADVKGTDEEDDGNETVTETTQRVLRSRAKGKGKEKQKEESTPLPGRKTKRKRHRENKSNTPSDPMEFAQKLVDRLPKRRKKVKEEAPDKSSKPRPTTRKRKMQPKKMKAAAPTTRKGEVCRHSFRHLLLIN